ncbi:MAG: hypothetical protein KF866_00650 [Phycisphaeraceae bacterium]|nr:hypothetical protein [Phycisphaeraceae bacterium]MCW5755146.1 hypothetical protein [Phycisphaeraceae bacterium]
MQDETSGPAPGKSRKPLVIGAVAAIMVIEAVAVVLLVSLTSGGSRAAAAQLDGAAEAAGEASTEIQVVQTRFQNLSSGRVWDWETEIYLKVKNKHAEQVRSQLERRKAEIADGISKIFRQAQHSQLREPGLQTVTRQVTAYLEKAIGVDAEGNPYIERVLIPKCDGYPADF